MLPSFLQSGVFSGKWKQREFLFPTFHFPGLLNGFVIVYTMPIVLAKQTCDLMTFHFPKDRAEIISIAWQRALHSLACICKKVRLHVGHSWVQPWLETQSWGLLAIPASGLWAKFIFSFLAAALIDTLVCPYS